jgi:hypothetical protein
VEPLYREDYINSRILKFDKSAIPEEFRILEILIGRWSLTDAADLDDEIDIANLDDLKVLSGEVGKLYGGLLDWLADENVQSSYNASYDTFSDTYEALTLLITACDLADIRLEQDLGLK